MARKSNKKKVKSKAPTGASRKSSTSINWRQFYPLFGIILLTVFAFWPSSNSEFVNYDDDVNLYDYPAVHAINFENLKELANQNVIGNYNPLSSFSFAIEIGIHGQDVIASKNAFPFQVTNILLHLLCLFLVWQIGVQMKLSNWVLVGSVALFALHPMRVESVSWVTERKDVLYGFFFLWALWLYCKSWNQKNKKLFIWIFILMILSGLSKIQAVSLPLSMLALDFYFKRKIKWKLLLEKIPFFGLSLLFGIIGIIKLKEFGSLEQGVDFDFGQRLLIGGYSLTVYIIKAIFPYEMAPLYPYPAKLGGIFYATIISSIAFVGLVILSFVKRWRLVFAGLFFFLVNVIFLLQILGAGQGFQADRFTYIAYLGLFWIVGLGLQKLVDRSGALKWLGIGIGILLLIYYSYSTYVQKQIWTNSETLWTHVLKHYDKTPLPYGNRANHYRDNGMNEQALSDYSSAISLQPDNPKYYNSRAKLYFLKNQSDLAIADYNLAISYNPDDASYYANRGAAYAQKGNVTQALYDLTECLRRNPNYLTGLSNRSLVYKQAGQWQNALKDINSYLSLNPANAGMWIEKAQVLSRLDRRAEAPAAITQAINSDPRNPVYYFERAKSYINIGNKNAARKDIQTAQSMGFQVPPDILQKINY